MKYRVQKRPDPTDDDGKMKYHATPFWNGKVPKNQFHSEISQMCTANSADVKAVMDAASTVLLNHILNGDIVEIDELGTFRISFSADGHDSDKKVSASDIRDIRILFKANPDLKKSAKTVQFERLKVPGEKSASESEEKKPA